MLSEQERLLQEENELFHFVGPKKNLILGTDMTAILLGRFLNQKTDDNAGSSRRNVQAELEHMLQGKRNVEDSVKMNKCARLSRMLATCECVMLPLNYR